MIAVMGMLLLALKKRPKQNKFALWVPTAPNVPRIVILNVELDKQSTHVVFLQAFVTCIPTPRPSSANSLY